MRIILQCFLRLINRINHVYWMRFALTTVCYFISFLFIQSIVGFLFLIRLDVVFQNVPWYQGIFELPLYYLLMYLPMSLIFGNLRCYLMVSLLLGVFVGSLHHFLQHRVLAFVILFIVLLVNCTVALYLIPEHALVEPLAATLTINRQSAILGSLIGSSFGLYIAHKAPSVWIYRDHVKESGYERDNTR